MTNIKTDHYLLHSLATGEGAGIQEIYRLIYPKVLSYVRGHEGDEDDAKDIMQKGLLQLAVRARNNDFEIVTSFEAYLFTICKNAWRRERKKLQPRVTNDASIDHVSEERDIALAAYEQEKWELFHEKLMEISQNCRELLRHFFNKLPYMKIADMMGYATENTVRQRIFKCKAKLKAAVVSDTRYNQLKSL